MIAYRTRKSKYIEEWESEEQRQRMSGSSNRRGKNLYSYN